MHLKYYFLKVMDNINVPFDEIEKIIPNWKNKKMCHALFQFVF